MARIGCRAECWCLIRVLNLKVANTGLKNTWTRRHHSSSASAKSAVTSTESMDLKRACALELPPQTWRSDEQGLTMRVRVILEFLDLTGTDPHWLLTGEGDHLQPERFSSKERSSACPLEYGGSGRLGAPAFLASRRR